ncbi:MAG TPA: GNAT family N-acetyltransferase [Hyphomonadaceae bacterium]|nr:GNAT family N-acetyltransferase [Hyphomonadaceae bacterium]
MIRLARAEDVEAVHAIYMHASVIPWLTHEPMDLDAFRDVFAKLLAAENFFVEERDGAVAGFYRITQYEGRASHVAELGTFAVHPDWQGRGLAREMIAGALVAMKAAGVIRAQLLVEPENARAIAFYTRMGFHQESIQRRAYRRSGEPGEIDDIVMVRFLDE